MARKLNELKVANEALDDVPELRRRIQEDGYLFFKRLQDPDLLLNLRLEMLLPMRDGDWLEPGSDLINGIANIASRCTEGETEYFNPDY
jgi:hypothetical protein